MEKRYFRKRFFPLLVCLCLLCSVFPAQAAVIPPLKPDPVQTFYIPGDNFGQVSVPTGEPANVYRAGTTVQSGDTNFTNDPASYWSGQPGGGAAIVGNNRALYFRVPVPSVDPAIESNENFKVSLDFNVQEKHNLSGNSTISMTLFTLGATLPETVSSMSAAGGDAASAVRAQYVYKGTAATSNAVGTSDDILTFDFTEYYKANKGSPAAWEFLMLPNCSMLSLYGAVESNALALRPRVTVNSGAEDTRTALEALSIEDTFFHGDRLPGFSKGQELSWSCVTEGQAGLVSDNMIIAPLVSDQVVTLRAVREGTEEFREFENVTVVSRKANPSAEIVIKGADVDDAKNRPGALTFKGFGLINANSTSELLMDYKAQHPDKYWELMNTLFGGTNPLFVHIKMEMGNDNDNSTGAEPATMRFADEEANAARSKGFQMTADAKKVNPNVKVSMLRWGVPRWVAINETGGTGSTANSEKVRENFYAWYRDTMFDIYEKYGYVLDFINPDQNESGLVVEQMKYFSNRLRNENDFPEIWTEEDKAKYRNMRFIAGDENAVPTRAANTIMEDPELMELFDIMGYHYFTNGSSAVRQLWEEHDFEIWYNEGCAIFGTAEASSNKAGGNAANAAGSLGGYQSPLAMIDGFMAGFIENNARKSHYIFQPAIGAFYEGSQYSHKNLLTATDPWSGYVHYDEALHLLSHYTSFSKAGWENEDNTNGIWRMVRNASACWPGNSNEHTWNTGGVPSYMTLASPDKTAFSTVFVNNSTREQFYKVVPDGDMLFPEGTELAVWETKAKSYMQKRETATLIDGAYWIAVEPFSIVTATTLTTAEPTFLPESVERTVLDTDDDGKLHDTSNSVLYADDFEYTEEPELDIWNSKTLTSYKAGYLESRGGGGRYLHVKNGAFAVVNGKLKQLLDAAPTAWNGSQPNLIVGDFRWMNYKASIDVDLSDNAAQDSSTYGRLTIRQQIGPNGDDGSVNGYSLRVYRSGEWQLLRNGVSVASGEVSGKAAFKLELEGRENLITGWIDGVQVVSFSDPVALYAGRIKLGTNWGITQFDNLRVETIPGYVPYATQFIDDGEDILTYSDTGWYRTAGNGGGAENFGRSLSTKEENGASLSFDFNGSGFSILGSNGNYSGALLDIYVDDMETPYLTGVSGRNLSGSERHRELYLLDSLTYGQHSAKVVITEGTFVMDGVMILAQPVAGNKNHVSLSEDLAIAIAPENADIANFLPKTVLASGYENGVAFSNRELPATWDADTSLFGRAWSSVSVNGTAAMGDIKLQLKVNIQLVVPSNLVYFVDAGTRDTGSDVYNSVKTLNPNLLNDVSDKAGDGDNETASSGWGSAAGPNGAPIVTGATASNMNTSLIYAPQNNANSSFYYDFTFPTAGTYYLAMGFYMPGGWGQRSLRVTASGDALAEPKVLIDRVSATTTPQILSGDELMIEVTKPGSVRLFFERLSGDAAVVSWIGISGITEGDVYTAGFDGAYIKSVSEAVKGNLYAAVYNKDTGALETVGITPVDVPVGSDATVDYGVDFNKYPEQEYNFVVFLWDDNFVPLKMPVSVTKE